MLSITPKSTAELKLTVTSTATLLYTLIDTAGSTTNSTDYYRGKKANAVLISPENGDIRVLTHGTPTATEGTLVREGSSKYLPGISLEATKIIRVGASDVAVSVELFESEPGESPSIGNVLASVRINTSDADVGVQNPFPVDGDSVYAKDINEDLSSIGTFTGDILSLFNDYTTEITETDATNPKTFTLHFKRPLKSNTIGIGSLTGDFSNVKISLKDLAGTVRAVIDDSADSTKHTSNIYDFTTSVFIEAVIEFYTADTVKISGMYIPKVQSRAISAIDGYVSETNSSETPLNAGVTFTGTQVDTLNYGMVILAVNSDVASATDGLIIQFRSTPTSTWREADSYTIAAGAEKTFSMQTPRRFMRVLYTNGAINQTTFDLQTTLKPVYVKPSSHRVADSISGQDDAELVKATLAGEDDNGVFQNVKTDLQRNLRINSFPYTYSISEGAILNHDPLLKFGTRTLIAANTNSTIWEGTTALYAYMTTAQQLKVSSTSGNDTGAGTGARTLFIQGQDINNVEISETITLLGATVVTTVNNYFRVYRCFVVTTGTSATNEGTISILNNASTATQAIINIGDGQTLMTLWTVPAGKTAYITNGSFSTDSNRGSTISFFVRQLDGGIIYPWLIKYRAYTFSGNENFPFTIPFKIPEKTDIEIRTLTPTSAGVTSAGATFELWYEDN